MTQIVMSKMCRVNANWFFLSSSPCCAVIQVPTFRKLQMATIRIKMMKVRQMIIEIENHQSRSSLPIHDTTCSYFIDTKLLLTFEDEPLPYSTIHTEMTQNATMTTACEMIKKYLVNLTHGRWTALGSKLANFSRSVILENFSMYKFLLRLSASAEVTHIRIAYRNSATSFAQQPIIFRISDSTLIWGTSNREKKAVEMPAMDRTRMQAISFLKKDAEYSLPYTLNQPVQHARKKRREQIAIFAPKFTLNMSSYCVVSAVIFIFII